jgi:NAD(P)-dependent dehydrogenase (short-subunit alcohol dehydrogenase family)
MHSTLITGAASGIGAGLAAELAQRGHHLIVTDVDAAASEAVAARLRSAGYEVVAANTALGTYRVSRIYYTDGHRADAVALRARFPAFQQIAPAPANLSRRIALHVVIGQNYR